MQTDIAVLIIQSFFDAVPKILGAFWEGLWLNPWVGASFIGIFAIAAITRLRGGVRRTRRVR